MLNKLGIIQNTMLFVNDPEKQVFGETFKQIQILKLCRGIT